MRATLFRYLWYLVPEVPLVPVVPENLISDILVSPPFQKYITPMVNIENITPMVNIENGEIETPATLFRYLYYLLYLVPEVPVVPVAHKNLISDILVSPAFQKYITPMVNTEKI